MAPFAAKDRGKSHVFFPFGGYALSLLKAQALQPILRAIHAKVTEGSPP